MTARRTLPPGWAVAAVVAGGSVGTLARYGLGQRFPTVSGGFPVTTLVENVAGAALLGLLISLMTLREPARRWVRPLATTGVLGSFTTFSTFSTELVLLLDDDRTVVAASYVAATVILGVAAATSGVVAGRRVAHRGAGSCRGTGPEGLR